MIFGSIPHYPKGSPQMCKQLSLPSGTACKPPFYPGKVWYRACFYYNWRSQIRRLWFAVDPSLSPQGDPAMKKALFVFSLLFSTAAFGQYLVGSSNIGTQPYIPALPDHPAHASYAPMSSGQSVLGSGSYASAQGERPVSDFPQPEAVSLGAAARELRKEHTQLKKARAVWVNQ
jgi:hypothetical protein